jgi:hypothetical protein
VGENTASRNGEEIVGRGPREQFRRVAAQLQDALDGLREEKSEGLRGALVDHAFRAVGVLVELVDQLPSVESAVGVVRLQADAVRAGDRLVVDLIVSHEFPGHPPVLEIRHAGPMVILRYGPVGGQPAGEWSASAVDPLLVNRPPLDPAPPPPLPVGLVDPAVAPEPMRPGARLTEETAEAGVARVARILDEHEQAGSPVQDPERGVLWLPTHPWPLPRRVRSIQ